MGDEQREDELLQSRRDQRVLRQIEQLRDDFSGEDSLIIECIVDDAVSLLFFDVPVSMEDQTVENAGPKGSEQ